MRQTDLEGAAAFSCCRQLVAGKQVAHEVGARVAPRSCPGRHLHWLPLGWPLSLAAGGEAWPWGETSASGLWSPLLSERQGRLLPWEIGMGYLS